MINSLNKKKLKENRIFIKIDDHFNKLKSDKSPKLVKKCFQGVIDNLKTNHSNTISNEMNIAANSKNNYRSITYEKYTDKNNKQKEINNNINIIRDNNKTPNSGEKMKYLNNKKNRVKIKLNTPITNNLYLNKEEFNIVKNKEKINLNRKNTPNIGANNKNSIQINNHNNKKKKEDKYRKRYK